MPSHLAQKFYLVMVSEATLSHWLNLALLSDVHTQNLESNDSWFLSIGNCKQVMKEAIKKRERETGRQTETREKRNGLKPDTPLLSAPVLPENLALSEELPVAPAPSVAAASAALPESPPWSLEVSSELLLSFGADDGSLELEGFPSVSVFVMETFTSSETWSWQDTSE